MSQRANIASIDVIDAFRSNLLVFTGKARHAVEEVGEEVIRTRVWLENDRRTYWENQVRHWTKELERAQQAVFSANVSSLRGAVGGEERAAQRARLALSEAQDKLKRVRHWARDFDNRVDPLVKQLEHLRVVLAQDMPKAAAWLAQAVKTLDAYADLSPSAVSGVSQPAESKPDEAAKAEMGPAAAPDTNANPSEGGQP